MQFDKILVVCVGNICRSPIGEQKLQQLLPHKHIRSAGIATERSRLAGKSADASAKKVAADNGLDLSAHEARQLTAQMCRENDLILVMEKGHIGEVANIAPEARGKTLLFGQWINGKDIPDPYRQGMEAFEHVYQLIDQAANAWSAKL